MLKNAFVHANIDTEIYIEQPIGLERYYVINYLGLMYSERVGLLREGRKRNPTPIQNKVN
jgi:hypothetical protein